MDCRKKYLKDISNGRDCGTCKCCNKKLTVKNNKTGTCIDCLDRSKIIRVRKTENSAWNKGISIFKSIEDKRIKNNLRRKELRKIMPTDKKIADRVRTLIRVQMKRAGTNKNTKTSEIIGCCMSDYVKHIESLFEDWMTWNNYGNNKDQWNIDHIQPVSKFDLTNEIELKKAFHFSNCRPLSSIDNFKKGNKLFAITATVTFGYSH
jgi:hypothetical protein